MDCSGARLHASSPSGDPDAIAILLVGESSDEREMYAAAMRLAGFSPLQARSIAEGRQMAVASAPEAVVVDAGRLGCELGASIVRGLRRENRASRGVPLVVLTTQPAAAEYDSAQGERVLLKPCLPDVLVRAVCDLLASDGIGPSGAGRSA